MESRSTRTFRAIDSLMNCPKCQSTRIIKYGHTHYGKPRSRCRDCGRQFVEKASRQPIDEATRQLIDKLLLERLALAAIARITDVSERSPEGADRRLATTGKAFALCATNVCQSKYVNQKFYQVPKTINVIPKKLVR